MANKNTSQLIQKSKNYGLQELLKIMGEPSQESTTKGLLSRLQVAHML